MGKDDEQYMGYLAHEMTIMGILSAFCVAVPSLILDRLTSAASGELAEIWAAGEKFFWEGSMLMLLAAMLFYKQRSLLAFYYGRIAYGKELEDGPSAEFKSWKDMADSWTTWIPYQMAFWIAVAGVGVHALGFLSHSCPLVKECPWRWRLLPIAILAVWLVLLIFTHKDRPIQYQYNPWIDGWRRLTKRGTKK